MTDLWTGGIGGSSRSDSRILTGGIRGRWDRTLNNARMDAALDFITSGNFDRVNAYGVGVFDTGGGASNLNPSRCRTSSDCGVGYMCVNGACRRSSGTGTSTGSGTSNGRTDTNCPTDPYPDGDPSPPAPGGQNCSGGSGGGSGGIIFGPCSKPSCGSTTTIGSGGGGGSADCCGERCCRTIGGQQTFGVQCFCGPCPPPGRCQKWCDSYYKANNRQAEGCSEAATCSECENCVSDSYSAKCVPATSDVPCWCEGNEGCGQCEQCQEDGTCEYSCENCETCYTQYNQPCSCGYFNIQCCTSACDEYSLSHRKCTELGCAKACGDPDTDPCQEQCTTKTVCGTPGGEAASCPAEYRDAGTITTHHDSGDVTCRLCEKCTLPPECEPCDCNCHDDCPECELCGADGKCYTDPVCDGDKRTVWKRDSFTTVYQSCGGERQCGSETFNRTYTSQEWLTGCGPLPHRLEVTGAPILRTEPGQCDFVKSTVQFKVYDADGALILDANSMGTVTGSVCYISGDGGGGLPYQVGLQDCP